MARGGAGEGGVAGHVEGPQQAAQGATAAAAAASRLEVTDPTPDAGVIAEVITTGAETVLMSPSSMGFNMEATPTTNIPCAVTNKSGSTGTVSVTLNVLQLEA